MVTNNNSLVVMAVVVEIVKIIIIKVGIVKAHIIVVECKLLIKIN